MGSVGMIVYDFCVWIEKLVGGSSWTFWMVVQNFFNRSPLTLKFEAGKIREREYRKERERERARARARASARARGEGACDSE